MQNHREAIKKELFPDELNPSNQFRELRGAVHYTSIDTLERIIRGRSFQLSSPLFMNDLQEVRGTLVAAIKITRFQLGKVEISSSLTAFKEYFESLIYEYDAYRLIEVFVASFTEWDGGDDGNLAMWRGYGNDGHGVAVVVYPNVFSSTLPLLAGRVNYISEEERDKKIHDVLTAILPRVFSSNLSDEDVKASARLWFRWLLYQAIFWKHPGFRVENEIRIAYLAEFDTKQTLTQAIEMQIRGKLVVPIVKLSIDALDVSRTHTHWRDIIQRIILGPGHSKTENRLAFQLLLKHNDCEDLAEKVKVSKIPYRGSP